MVVILPLVAKRLRSALKVQAKRVPPVSGLRPVEDTELNGHPSRRRILTWKEWFTRLPIRATGI